MSEEIQNEQENNLSLADNEEFKEAVQTQMRKIHNQGMVIGFQTACHTMLDKIHAFESGTGKKSNNDYKRLMKEIKRFCDIGVSRKANTSDEPNETEETTVETVQN